MSFPYSVHMLRLTHHQRPLTGLGLPSVSDITRSVVQAVTPAINDAMPSLIESAWPTIESKLPGVIDGVMPRLQQQVEQMVPRIIPQITAQAPKIIEASVPTLKAKVLPLVKTEADKVLQSYLKQQLGPFYALRGLAPVLTLVATGVSLFASGIIIYKFWADE